MKIKELLDTKEKWCKGMSARDSNNVLCFPQDDMAVSWCLDGAFRRCYANCKYEEYKQIYDKLTETIRDKYNLYIVSFNDSPDTTFDDIRSLLEELDI